MPLLPILVCGAAVGGLLLAERAGSTLGVWLTKPVAAGAFVWAALAWGAPATAYGRWLLLGLVLCWWGDLLLIPHGRPRWFRAGIFAFLAAHLAYIAAFVHRGPAEMGLVMGGLFAAALAGLVWRWLGPRLPAAFRRLVWLYVAVICGMLVTAFGAAQGAEDPRIALGTTLFAISDLSVARDRFVAPGFPNRAWGLPLYFAAQLVLASTVDASTTSDGRALEVLVTTTTETHSRASSWQPGGEEELAALEVARIQPLPFQHRYLPQ